MLTDANIARALPEHGKRYRKLSDDETPGLQLLISTNGATVRRVWRYEYRINGRESTLGFGRYPQTSIDDARRQAAAARDRIKRGEDPAKVNRDKRAAIIADVELTFGRIGREYLNTKMRDKRERTRKKHEWLFSTCLAGLHGKPLSAIQTRDIVTACKSYEARERYETAHRMASFVAAVYRFANRSGYTTHNPARDITGKDGPLAQRIVESHPGITDPRKFGELMRYVDSDTYSSPTVRHALQLLARTAVRPGELRGATWPEIDLAKAEWTVPVNRMKVARGHWVPLSRQAVAILKAQKAISGGGLYVFPGYRSGRPLSDNTMNSALAAIGYKPGHWLTTDEHVPHGFRTSFSTIMNERDENPKIIELCLAHGDEDKVAGVYNRSERRTKRRALMQQWSDLIDELKAGK